LGQRSLAEDVGVLCWGLGDDGMGWNFRELVELMKWWLFDSMVEVVVM
jgi:hypothetical protein